MLSGVQANVAQRRALSQLYQAKGVAPGTVDAVSDITLWPKPSCIPAKGVGPKAQTWAWPAQIRARSCAGNPTLWDFRKNAEHSMCELTTGWILEKCPKSSVCTYHNVFEMIVWWFSYCFDMTTETKVCLQNQRVLSLCCDALGNQIENCPGIYLNLNSCSAD